MCASLLPTALQRESTIKSNVLYIMMMMMMMVMMLMNDDDDRICVYLWIQGDALDG